MNKRIETIRCPECHGDIDSCTCPAFRSVKAIKPAPDAPVGSALPPEESDTWSAGRKARVNTILRSEWELIEANCSCGQAVLIELNANRNGMRRTCRTDGKRIFYPDESQDDGYCVFRCKACGEPIGDTCPQASYGKNQPLCQP